MFYVYEKTYSYLTKIESKSKKRENIQNYKEYILLILKEYDSIIKIMF